MFNIKRKKHLCFVDDDKFYLETIKETIDKNLYDVSFFEDPIDFIEYKNKHNAEYLYKIESFKNSIFSKKILNSLIYKKYPIDIIFSDYSMPIMNGIELLKKCSGFYNVLLTSKSAYKKAADAFNKGIINYFSIKSDFDDNIFNEIINNWEKSHFENVEIRNTNIDSDSYNEYYILDNDGSLLIKNNEKYELIFSISKEDLSIAEQILLEDGKKVPKGKIPILFKDNIDLDDVCFSETTYETDLFILSKINDQNLINILLSSLSNNE